MTGEDSVQVVRVTLWLDARRSWPDLEARATQAEEAGWDGVRIGDAPDGRECWAVAGALAMAVPRLRLEVVVRDEWGRHPAVVAKLASTVDQLSGGRLLLGWAPAGDADGEARLGEGCEVVKSLAGQERTTFAGRFYRLHDAPLDPQPRQRPLPVMVVGGSALLAAACADHWSISGSVADVRAQLAALAEACRQRGRDRSAIEVSAWTADPAVPIDPATAAHYAAAGVDHWVVPEASVDVEADGWPAGLAQIREATARIGRA
jgi:alkanesulfonate monooxygenase SsuD/methylene tetrahydromethanopterin reductase-like flavin-dependent oxidoreductase (luciferase family)